MSEYMNNLPDPGEYWPEAEKLLNGHFQAKRRRRAAWWLAVIFLAVSTVFLLSREDERVSADNSPAAPEHVRTPENTAAAGRPVPSSTKIDAATASATSETVTASDPSVKQAKDPLPSEKTTIAAVAQNNPGVKQPSREKTFQKHDRALAANHPAQTLFPHPAVLKETKTNKPIQISSSAPDEPASFSENPERTLSGLHFLNARAVSIQQEPYPDISGKQEHKPLPGLKSGYDFITYAGMAYADKVINSPGNTIYMQRRETEESATFLPYLGAQIAKSFSKFEIRAGAEFSVLGERVNYSPYKNGEYYNSYLDWDPYSYTVTDTDSAWIFGMLFLQTNSFQVNDSIQVTVTDTLNGRHYDASILAANGTNRWYLIQFPVEFSYSLLRGRFGIGISGGVAPGIIVGTEGKYLLKDESGVREIYRSRSGNFMFSAGGGVEFSYLLGDKCSVLLRPSARYYLTPVEEENGASKNYRTIGIHAGIRYRIR